MQDINAVILQRMEEQHVRQSELGRLLGLPRQAVWASLHTDRRRWTVKEFITVCLFLGLEMEAFRDERS